MNTYARTTTFTGGPLRWLERAAHWLDDRGKPAWIAVMVIGFVFFWPVGLAILAYMIWSKRMIGTCTKRRAQAPSTGRSSGNSAFDAYRDETLRRLQDEQASFESFLDRLRQAKDKAEFDQFMEDRAKTAKDARAQDDRASSES